MEEVRETPTVSKVSERSPTLKNRYEPSMCGCCGLDALLTLVFFCAASLSSASMVSRRDSRLATAPCNNEPHFDILNDYMDCVYLKLLGIQLEAAASTRPDRAAGIIA